jgi:hypothetical protein
VHGASVPRRQCAKCPWKRDTDPRDIPHGYSEARHAKLRRTIAEPGVLSSGPLRMMACHEAPVERELPCVGWLAHQLGSGDNIALRWAVHLKRVSADIALDGPQKQSFEDTLPRRP